MAYVLPLFHHKPLLGQPWASCCSTMAAQPTILPTEVVDQVNAIMDGPLPVNQQVDQVCQVLTSFGYAHQQTLVPNQVLVHPKNRASQMINAHDMWSQGMKITQVGWKRQNLGESIAMEISKNPATRTMQLEKNAKLIQEAGGSMAPISGQEGFLALLSFSTVTFFFPTQPPYMGQN